MDLVTGIIGFVLILAPFLFGFFGNLIATWASIAVGMMLFINSCVQAMQRFEVEEDEDIDIAG